MSDIQKGLPVRTESNGDVAIKVVDGTLTSQVLTVNADGSVNITDNGASITVDATNLDIRDLAFATDKVDVTGSDVTATVTATDLDIRNLVFATDKVDVTGSDVTATVSGTVELGATTLSALESITVQNGAGGSAVNIQDGGNSITVDATDLDIRDLSHSQDSVKVGDGTDLLAVNADGSINVVVLDSTPGTPTNDHNTASTVAGGGTSTHTYTSTGNFYLTQVEFSASGRGKIEVQVNGSTKFVKFSTESDPNVTLTLSQPILATTGQTVDIIRTNRNNQAQDLYSTISGYTL